MRSRRHGRRSAGSAGWWLLWRLPASTGCPREPRSGHRPLAVIIPARNEAGSLPVLLADLAAQPPAPGGDPGGRRRLRRRHRRRRRAPPARRSCAPTAPPRAGPASRGRAGPAWRPRRAPSSSSWMPTSASRPTPWPGWPPPRAHRRPAVGAAAPRHGPAVEALSMVRQHRGAGRYRRVHAAGRAPDRRVRGLPGLPPPPVPRRRRPCRRARRRGRGRRPGRRFRAARLPVTIRAGRDVVELPHVPAGRRPLSRAGPRTSPWGPGAAPPSPALLAGLWVAAALGSLGSSPAARRRGASGRARRRRLRRLARPGRVDRPPRGPLRRPGRSLLYPRVRSPSSCSCSRGRSCGRTCSARSRGGAGASPSAGRRDASARRRHRPRCRGVVHDSGRRRLSSCTVSPDERLDADRWLLRERAFEGGGRLYRTTLAGAQWKKLLPEAGARLPRRLRQAGPALRATAHLDRYRARDPAGRARPLARHGPLPLFALWNPPGCGRRWPLYAVAVNAPCIASQRYNRLRISPRAGGAGERLAAVDGTPAAAARAARQATASRRARRRTGGGCGAFARSHRDVTAGGGDERAAARGCTTRGRRGTPARSRSSRCQRR